METPYVAYPSKIYTPSQTASPPISNNSSSPTSYNQSSHPTPPPTHSKLRNSILSRYVAFVNIIVGDHSSTNGYLNGNVRNTQ